MKNIESLMGQKGWLDGGKVEKKYTQQLIFELSTIASEVKKIQPDQNVADLIQQAWLGLRKFAELPNNDVLNEIKHPFGAVTAFTAGWLKSFIYKQPMLELHATVCPSYLEEENERDGLYIGTNIRERSLTALGELNQFLNPLIDQKVVTGLEIHTPSPDDLKTSYQSVFGLFNHGEFGTKSMEAHWQQMNQIISNFPNFRVAKDLVLIEKNFNYEQSKQFLNNPAIASAWDKFKQSQFIYDAFERYGCDVMAAFTGYYLGSIFAYGNHETAFLYDSPKKVKLYFNFEINNGPESFAGKKIGVDFRHLLSGYHLALMPGNWELRAPWAK